MTPNPEYNFTNTSGYSPMTFLTHCAHTLVSSANDVAVVQMQAVKRTWEDGAERMRRLAEGCDGKDLGAQLPVMLSSLSRAVQDNSARAQDAALRITEIGMQAQLRMTHAFIHQVSVLGDSAISAAETVASATKEARAVAATPA